VVALRGRIEDIELPEQVDVLLSVFTGNLLFNEGLMPSLYHARDRWLKPGGAMFPDRARLVFAAVEAAAQYAKTAGRYRNVSLGIDYAAVTNALANGWFLIDRDEAAPAPITTPTTAVELDLRNAHDDRIRWTTTAEATRDGMIHGLMGWIELRLGNTWLSSAPDAPAVHWHSALLPLASPVPVRHGQVVDLTFQYIDEVHQVWSVGVDKALQRHATVLGNPDAAIDVMLSSAACASPLGPEGELVERALALMREGKSNQAIASELRQIMPQRFRDEGEALKRVGTLSARYRTHPLRKS
jgi:hypothetical protein